jgi:hypothetical protein
MGNHPLFCHEQQNHKQLVISRGNPGVFLQTLTLPTETPTPDPGYGFFKDLSFQTLTPDPGVLHPYPAHKQLKAVNNGMLL